MDSQEAASIEQMKKMEEFKKHILSRMLDRAAFERLGRVRIANPNLANQVELYMLQIFQSGKLQGTVSDEQLKEVLKYLSPAETKKTIIKRV